MNCLQVTLKKIASELKKKLEKEGYFGDTNVQYTYVPNKSTSKFRKDDFGNPNNGAAAMKLNLKGNKYNIYTYQNKDGKYTDFDFDLWVSRGFVYAHCN